MIRFFQSQTALRICLVQHNSYGCCTFQSLTLYLERQPALKAIWNFLQPASHFLTLAAVFPHHVKRTIYEKCWIICMLHLYSFLKEWCHYFDGCGASVSGAIIWTITNFLVTRNQCNGRNRSKRELADAIAKRFLHKPELLSFGWSLFIFGKESQNVCLSFKFTC